MKYLIYIMALSSLFSFFRCKSSEFTPDTYKKQVLYFGNGGGFAGALTEYSLMDNGQLFGKSSPVGEWQKLDPIDKIQTEQLFSQIEQLGLRNIKHNIPGNMYSFIRIGTAQGEHKLVWGNESMPKNESIVTYYKILRNLVKDQKLIKSKNPVR